MTDAPEARFIDVDGRRTRVVVFGGADAPPVLLLHGIGRSLEDWAEQIGPLAEKYRVITLDIPGFGFSVARPGPVTLASFAHGVWETLDALGEHRPVRVVGNSLGGAIAMQLLALQPERVQAMVLVNSAGFGSEVTPLLRILAVPGLGWLATRRAFRSSVAMLERATFVDKSLATAARIEHSLRVWRQPGAGDVRFQAARALAGVRGVRPEWRTELLDAVARTPRPTLIVWGSQDRVLPAHHLDAASRLLPHARSHLFAATGHMPQIERADEFASLVREFIDSVPVRSA